MNTSPIATYGQRTLTLKLGLHRIFSCLFVVADIRQTILGVDILSFYKLFIDIYLRRLNNLPTYLFVNDGLSASAATGLGAFSPSSS